MCVHKDHCATMAAAINTSVILLWYTHLMFDTWLEVLTGTNGGETVSERRDETRAKETTKKMYRFEIFFSDILYESFRNLTNDLIDKPLEIKTRLMFIVWFFEGRMVTGLI